MTKPIPHLTDFRDSYHEKHAQLQKDIEVMREEALRNLVTHRTQYGLRASYPPSRSTTESRLLHLLTMERNFCEGMVGDLIQAHQMCLQAQFHAAIAQEMVARAQTHAKEAMEIAGLVDEVEVEPTCH